MNSAQLAAIVSHLEKLPLRCPMCGAQGADNWTLHENVVAFPVLDSDLQPTGMSFAAVLLKCDRCRYVAMFRAAGPDSPEDLSAGAGPG